MTEGLAGVCLKVGLIFSPTLSWRKGALPAVVQGGVPRCRGPSCPASQQPVAKLDTEAVLRAD